MRAPFRLTVLLLLVGFPVVHAQPPPARLSVAVTDAGRATPVRARLVEAATGRVAPLPEAAVGVQYGRNDRAEGFAFQPDSAFYVDGGFEVALAPGVYRLTLSKGFEYVAQTHTLTLAPGDTAEHTFALERWIDMPARGWFSADDHIHLRRSPRENPYILTWIAAEDIHVGALLRMGDFWTTYYAQYAFGEAGLYRDDGRMLTSGQEDPRTHEVGHTISLGHDAPVRFRSDYYSYDRLFDAVHDHGGLTGYAHQGMSFHGYRGLTLDVLRGKVDFLELLQFCVDGGPLHLDHYYHFLDLGYRLTATAGSDFPWCGVGEGWDARIGNARFYTYLGDDFSFDAWKAGVRAGRTFVTSGPMLDVQVGDRRPGETLDLEAGARVTVRVDAFGHAGQIPLSELELVAHGRVVARVTPAEAGQSTEHLRLEVELPVERGQWIAARTLAGAGQVAHTTPVYVTVDGGGFANPDTAPGYLDLSEAYLRELEAVLAEPDDRMDHHAWRHRDALQARIDATRTVLDSLRTGLP